MSFVALWSGVAAIGGLASVLRYLVHGAFTPDADAGFPLGTLAVNLSGSLLLGALLGAAVQGHSYLLLGTAAIGSYTTFSTWMLDSDRLARDGRLARTIANLAGSLALGLGALLLGRLIAGG
ncbi:MAG: fluoride efflux transporter CrcB [Solirubrobacteraceae bacterium]